ncbi:hypothetical protein HG536_0G01850 [Torulaspora globosa]|uniref:Uncharacterized protein n=1 Tax=Torulaspora globosa TaxID=48254 RepID=A0A7G3ZLE0_9SACH|nr:uncharacterized protein HG536_0G01850 [Torulaspora globosa]QLL34326.1 hypothetical protein HG536_0G01850 [Torulaspora globosa]
MPAHPKIHETTAICYTLSNAFKDHYSHCCHLHNKKPGPRHGIFEEYQPYAYSPSIANNAGEQFPADRSASVGGLPASLNDYFSSCCKLKRMGKSKENSVTCVAARASEYVDPLLQAVAVACKTAPRRRNIAKQPQSADHDSGLVSASERMA